MQDYLKQFTERAIIGTRSGDLERGKIQHELETLLKDKPKDASPDMALYLEFLIAVVKGEDTEELWGKLNSDLQNIFGEVIKKFKGAEISEKLKELTKKVILARQKGTDKDAVIGELEMILSSQPKDGGDGVARYIQYLHALAHGNETEEMASGMDQGLVDIFNSAMQEVSGMDMMTFFTRLTESTFHEAKTGEVTNNISVRQVIGEILGEANKPPRAIINYLNLLLGVLDGGDVEDLLIDVAPEFQTMFNEFRNSN